MSTADVVSVEDPPGASLEAMAHEHAEQRLHRLQRRHAREEVRGLGRIALLHGLLDLASAQTAAISRPT
eukprot:5722400-Lingulodinium_polyedra.AAC.1